MLTRQNHLSKIFNVTKKDFSILLKRTENPTKGAIVNPMWAIWRPGIPGLPSHVWGRALWHGISGIALLWLDFHPRQRRHHRHHHHRSQHHHHHHNHCHYNEIIIKQGFRLPVHFQKLDCFWNQMLIFFFGLKCAPFAGISHISGKASHIASSVWQCHIRTCWYTISTDQQVILFVFKRF